MNDVVNTILKHPIATCIVLGAVATLIKSFTGADAPAPEVKTEE